MEIKKTIKVSAPISPYDTDDVQPTHFAEFGKGGYRTVKNIDERNAISNDRREVGMIVFVSDTQKLYILQNGITNSHWTSFDTIFEGSDGGKLYISTTEPTDIENNSIWLNSNSGILYFRDSTNTMWKPLKSNLVDGGSF